MGSIYWPVFAILAIYNNYYYYPSSFQLLSGTLYGLTFCSSCMLIIVFLQTSMISHLAKGKSIHRVTLCLPLDESFGPHLSVSRVEVNIEKFLNLNDVISQCDFGDGNIQIDSSLSMSATEVCVSLISFIFRQNALRRFALM